MLQEIMRRQWKKTGWAAFLNAIFSGIVFLSIVMEEVFLCYMIMSKNQQILY